jgi:hypothetical protein
MKSNEKVTILFSPWLGFFFFRKKSFLKITDENGREY